MTADLQSTRGAPPTATPDATRASFSERNFVLLLVLVVVAALVWRVVYVAVIGTRDGTGGDPFYYHAQANLLADGHGFANPFVWRISRRVQPSAQHPPLYTLLLSAVSFLGGRSYLAHKVTSALIGAGTVAVIGLVGHRIGGARAGLIAAVIAAAYPNLWVLDGLGLSEDLFALAIGLTILAAYRFRSAPSWTNAVLVGAAIALAALTRGEAILLVAFLAAPIVLLTTGLDWRRRFALLGISVVATGVVVAPWVTRNLTAFEEPVLLSTNTYGVLAVANCDQTYHGQLIGFWNYNCDLGNDKGDESQRALRSRDKGLRYIREHADRVPVVVAARVGRVWEVFRPWQNAVFTGFEGRTRPDARAGLLSYWALAPLAVVGAWLVRRRGVTLVPLVAQVVLVTVTVATVYGSVRFRLPAEVVIASLAAVAIDVGVAALSRAWATRRAVPHHPAPISGSRP